MRRDSYRAFRKLCLAALSAALLLAIIGCSSHRPTEIDPQKMLSSGLESDTFIAQPVEEWQLPNGVTVMYRYDPELPFVTGSIMVRGGTLLSPYYGRGVIGALGALMRSGGAGDLSPDQLDAELDRLSATVSSSIAGESGGVSFASLSSDFPEVLSIARDVLLRPQLAQERLDLWRANALEGIRRRRDEPENVVDISMNQLLYGDTLYGRILTSTDVEKIQRIDLLRAHRALIRPDGAIITIVGDVSKEQVKKQVEQLFGTWQPRQETLPIIEPAKDRGNRGIYFVPGDYKQATILIAQLGIERDFERWAEMDVFNRAFGGGDFSSLLVKRIRTDLGLAYSTYGVVMPAKGRGRNIIMIQTRADATGKAVREALQILQDVQRKPLDKEFIDEQIRSLSNSLLFRYDSSEELVARRAAIRLLEYPENFDEQYAINLKQVTPEKVQEIANSYWDLNKLVIVAVGNETAYKSLVQELKSGSPLLRDRNLVRAKFGERLDPAVVMR